MYSYGSFCQSGTGWLRPKKFYTDRYLRLVDCRKSTLEHARAGCALQTMLPCRWAVRVRGFLLLAIMLAVGESRLGPMLRLTEPAGGDTNLYMLYKGDLIRKVMLGGRYKLQTQRQTQ